MRLNDWIPELRKQLNDELGLTVHKALIQLQLKDLATNEIHIHNATYTAKDALNLEVSHEPL